MEFNCSQTGPKVFSRVQTRILFGYVMLIALFAVVPIVAVRQVLLARLEAQVEKSQVRKIKEFRRLVNGWNPSRNEHFRDNVAAVFDEFLSRNVPNEDEFFIALLNGQFYKSSSKSLPDPLHPSSDSVKYWANLSEPEKGKEIYRSSTVLYRCEPITVTYSVASARITEKHRGVLVVAQIITDQHEEVNEVLVVIIHVMVAVLCVGGLGAVIAWILTGQVLARVRLLTETARLISESDLTQRIPVSGSDETAELTITFNQMLDRLEAAFTSQRDFINDAGHELRTPITIIRGYLELLGDDPKERQETVEIITDELERISRFIAELLLLAKAERPDFLTLDIVDINLLTEELYFKAKALGDRDWCLENKGSGYIVADRQRLTQIVINLAQNATQHTTDGDVIALGSEIADGNARFWVGDTGEGIPLTDQERIFQRFARSTNSYRRSEGAGLGLAIVKAIAQAHGGHVELVSRPGTGSTFTIVIPLEPPLIGLI